MLLVLVIAKPVKLKPREEACDFSDVDCASVKIEMIFLFS